MPTKAPPELKDLCVGLDVALCHRREKARSEQEDILQFDAAICEMLSMLSPQELKKIASYLSETLQQENADRILEDLWLSADPTLRFFRSRRKASDPAYVSIFKRILHVVEKMMSLTSPPDVFKGFCISLGIALGRDEARIRDDDFSDHVDGAINEALQWCSESELATLRDFLRLLLAQKNATERLSELWKRDCPQSLFSNRAAVSFETPLLTWVFTKALEATEQKLG